MQRPENEAHAGISVDVRALLVAALCIVAVMTGVLRAIPW
jgi:hypothetical protein